MVGRTNTHRFGAWQEGRVPQVQDGLPPLRLAAPQRLDRSFAFFFLVHVLDQGGDPVPLGLRTGRAVAKRRGGLGPVREEHVGEARARHAQVRVGPVLPVLLEGLRRRRRFVLVVGTSANVNVREPARKGVVAGGTDEQVKGPPLLAVGRADAARGEGLDGRGADVDKRHVRLVEELVVALLQRDALAPKGEGRGGGREEVAHARVADARARFVAPKGVGLVVRRLVEEHVVVRADPEPEVALLPQLLVLRAAGRGRVRKRAAVKEAKVEAAEARRPAPVQGRVGLFGVGLLAGTTATVFAVVQAVVDLAHGEGEGGRALEDDQLAGDGGERLGDLDGRRARPDQGDPFPAHVGLLVGPVGRVEEGALERIEAGPVGDVALGGEARVEQKVPGLEAAPLLRVDGPLELLLVPGGRRHARVELGVFA